MPQHQTDPRTMERVPLLLYFRLHVAPPVVLAAIATGELLPLLTSGLMFLPMIILTSELGAWSYPLNLFISLFTLVATSGLELAKRLRPSNSIGVRFTQIVLWWVYWLAASVAIVFGTYHGP